jgi:hypothetical protein
MIRRADGTPPVRHPVIRRMILAGATLLLLIVAWAAVSGAIRQLPRSQTFGQRVETGVQLACGLLSLLVVLTCFRWRRRAQPIRMAWASSLALVAGLSPLVWGPPMPLIALLFGALALLVAWVIIRVLKMAEPA